MRRGHDSRRPVGDGAFDRARRILCERGDSRETDDEREQQQTLTMVSYRVDGSGVDVIVDAAYPCVGDDGGALAVEIRIVGRPGREAVDVAVAHAEHRRDQHGVVNLEVGRALRARPLDVVGGHVLAAFGGLAGNRQQRLQLVRDVRLLEDRTSRRRRAFVAARWCAAIAP